MLLKKGDDLLKMEEKFSNSSTEVIAREMVINYRKINKYKKLIEDIDHKIREKKIILGELAFQELSYQKSNHFVKKVKERVIENYNQLIN